MKLVMASGNAGKLAEFERMIGARGIECIAQGRLGVEDIEETAPTFLENALLKARHAARITGLPALADDSGLCVDALDGAPGLYSARYGGGHGDAARNIEKLLGEMAGVPDAARTARFHCAVVVLRHANDPQPLVAEGSWEGRILMAPQGTGGFGYDPVFIDPVHGCSAAEMEVDLKNRISHRAHALAILQKRLAELS